MAEPAGAAKDAVSRNSSQLFHKIMCIVLLTTHKIDVILQVEQRKGKARKGSELPGPKVQNPIMKICALIIVKGDMTYDGTQHFW